MKPAARRAVATSMLVAAVSLTGCKGIGRVLEPHEERLLRSPFAFESVAVLPFSNLTGDASPPCERTVASMWTLFHAELQRVEGLHVVPPAVVAATVRRAGLEVTSPREALDLARTLDVDAIIVGAVTSYDPYFKPRLGVALQVYQRRPAARQAPDILELAERGRPFAIAAGGRAPMAVLDRIYDAADRDIDRAVRQFARGRDALASAFGSELYLRDMEKYATFVCRRAIEELIAAERRRQEGYEHERKATGL